ncbi:hypothetical protein CLRAG_23780 [Clostridium ragsdalei P11]|uniref:Uncharacterized protein n=1 Tax=Clostridium ragsdalei P11 TaxID=1353534 RepID=A0A1A6ARI5_9CLOT|nr:hypothetical protein [Clostridium ragsdalei]OBR92672.1 hypothetical protein CLRAG_23780 [Clostridium ragsdalei P11]
MELLDNGLDSLKKAVYRLKEVSEIAETSPKYEYMLKEIIINLHHSTETLFKYLIHIKSPYLIYEDLNKFFKQSIEKKINNSEKNVKSNTIQFMDAINCVITIYDIDIEKIFYNKIIMLNENRNALTHYTFSFKPKETENYIALLLPELFKIYGKYIPTFDTFAETNNLYEDIEKIREKIDERGLEIILAFIKKWDDAEANMVILDQNPKNKGTVFNNRKKGATYSLCPCCNENMIYLTSTYITNSKEELYIGKCEYCGLEITLDDAKLLAAQFQSYSNIERKDLEQVLKSYLSGCLLTFEEKDSEKVNGFIKKNIGIISGIISKNREDIVEDMKNRYQYLMDDICTQMAEDYFMKNIYFNNDIVEQSVKDDDLEIKLSFLEASENIELDERYEEMIKRIRIITERMKAIDYKAYEMLLNKLATTYLSYHPGMYMSWDQNQVDVEFTFCINITGDDLESVIKFIS